MFTITITCWKWSKGHQCKKLYMNKKMQENSDNQSLNNINVCIVDRTTIIKEASEIDGIIFGHKTFYY